MEVEPDLGAHVPPLQAAPGLDAVVEGALEHLLAAVGPPGSFLLHVEAPYMVGHAMGPRVLGRRRCLDGEVAEALHGLCRPQQAVDEVTRGTVQ